MLYISGEESGGQLKLRAKRLGVSGKNLFVLTETNLDSILKEADKIKPDIMIVDSIQTIYDDAIKSAPGSVTQVRESALTLINRAKTDGISMLLVGHVNKEGGIAGPKVLEHMVDAVLLCWQPGQEGGNTVASVLCGIFGIISCIHFFLNLFKQIFYSHILHNPFYILS